MNLEKEIIRLIEELRKENKLELILKLLVNRVVEEGIEEVKVGECFPIDLDGATLCGYCQNHFRSDGEQDTCNDCLKSRGQ